MADFTFNFTTTTGLAGSLTSTVYGSTGTALGSQPSGTFVELNSSGVYLWYTTAMPALHRGIIIAFNGSTAVASSVVETPILDTAAIALSVWDYVLEGSRTAIQVMRLFASVLLGKSSGFATGSGTRIYRDLADTKHRVQTVEDGSGNRSQPSTLDGT